MMSSKLDWTVKLGDAVLAQQSDVMDAIQRLRARADANNKLTSNKQQRVTKTQQGGRQIITIEPTDPNMIYVPYWDPAVVYGEWPYAEYPPYYWGYPGYIAGGLIAAGLAFGAGWALSNWASGGYWWSGGVNWGNAGHHRQSAARESARGPTGNTGLAALEQGYVPVPVSGRAYGSFLRGAGPVRDNVPVPDGRAQGNFPLGADPVPDSARRAAGQGQRSYLLAGEVVHQQT